MYQFEFTRVIAVDSQQPLLHRIEPRNETRQSRLARSAPADNSKHLSGFDRERDIIERRRAFCAVPERYIFELNFPGELRSQSVAIAFALLLLVHNFAQHL